jgi:hypothetical protein
MLEEEKKHLHITHIILAWRWKYRRYHKIGNITYSPYTKYRHTILIPNMSDHCWPFKALLKGGIIYMLFLGILFLVRQHLQVLSPEVHHITHIKSNLWNIYGRLLVAPVVIFSWKTCFQTWLTASAPDPHKQERKRMSGGRGLGPPTILPGLLTSSRVITE